ncbi:MAG: hypothetical protein R3297_07490, partial [Desulfobulbales bacterium]|nr:hypothetical protein [Desulfobulbales bacterium]
MSANIMTKIVLTVVGVLVLVQILIYNGTQVNNLAESQAEKVRLSREIEELAATKEEMLHYLAGLQHEYNEIAASVPENILHGYEDHEEMLAGFLDYIKAAEISSVEATVSLQGGRKYINKPVPLFEHDLAYDYTFTRLTQAHKILSFNHNHDHN